MDKNDKKLISFEDSFSDTFKIFSKGLGTLSAIQAIIIGIVLGVVVLFVIGIALAVMIMSVSANTFDGGSGIYVCK